MRILVVTRDYPPDDIGAYGAMAAGTCERLARRGHDVAVLCAGDGATDTRRGVVIVRALRASRDGAANTARPFVESSEIERGDRASLDRMIESHRPDVLSYWDMGSLSPGLIDAGAEARIPVTFVIGDDWLVNAAPGVAELGIFCFVSQHTRDRAREHGVDPERWCLAPPGVDPELFPVGFDRAWEGHLLWVGMVTERKGILTAVRALDLLDGMTLRVLGPIDPAVRPALNEALDANGARDRVTFDVVPHEQIARDYQVADATLFTNTSEAEPFGLAPLESMACGTPVVSTAVGGAAEYCFDGENCLVVPPDDADALAHAVRRLVDPELRLRLSVGGVQTASVLSADTQAWIIERAMYAALDQPA